MILRGNSGSGKIPAARALQRRLGYHTMVISQNSIRRAMLWVKDGPDTPALSLLVFSVLDGLEVLDGKVITLYLFGYLVFQLVFGNWVFKRLMKRY